MCALTCELREELGLETDDLSEPPFPLCFVEHSKRGVLDLTYAFRTILPFSVMTKRHQTRGDGGYTALTVVPEIARESATNGRSRQQPGKSHMLLARLGGDGF